MKFVKIILLLCFICKNLSAQEYKNDSLFLSEQLDPYRKHLDSVLPYFDWQNLIDLYHQKEAAGDTILIIQKVRYDTLSWLNYTPLEFRMIDNVSLASPKYFTDNIFQLDSNNIVFIETEYNLNNRKELSYLKKMYSERKNVYDKIRALLRYINALNKSYSQSANFKFSKSITLSKYIRQIKTLFNEIPNNLTKATWLINYAKTLSNIAAEELYYYIYSVYVEAETVLLAPYFKSMNAVSLDKIVGNEYEKYIVAQKIGAQITDVYLGIVTVLFPHKNGDENNLLYPILRKITAYKFQLIEILTIISKYDKTWIEDLNDWEESIIGDFSLKPLEPGTQYKNELIADRMNVLRQYISKLLEKPALTITERRKAILYFSLGIMFDNNHEDIYAFKAYYNALEAALKSNYSIGGEWLEWLYYKLTEKYKNKFFQNSLSISDRSDYNKLVSLYLHTNKYENLEKTNPNKIYYTLRTINYVRYLCMAGYVDSAKKFLNTNKKFLIYDSSNLEKNINNIALVYKELTDNHWLEDYSNKTAREFYFDSLMASSYSNNGRLYVRYNGNQNIALEFYKINKIVDDSRWTYKTNELNEEIKNKTNEIEKLNIERIRLFKGNEKLNQEIRRKNEILNQTTNKNIQLDSTNSKLIIRNQELIKNSTTLAKTISTQKNKIWYWTKIGITGIVAAILLPLFVGFFIAKKKRKEIRVLNTEIKNLEEHKKSLEIETFDLKSIIEANRLTYKAELQSANDKILRELTVKHEIVGLISELYVGYENRFVNNSTDEVCSKMEFVEFGKRFHNLESYSKHYYKLLQSNDFNSVDDEIELCKKYVDVVKIRRSNYDVTFEDLRTVKRSDIVLPHHILNNFSKNSIEKGKIEGKPLKIIIEDKLINGDYCLTISDDGKGLPDNFNLKNLPEKSTGFKNALGQIEYYNENLKLPYTIYFNEQSVIDKTQFKKTSGVEVTLKFKSKSNAISS